MNTKKNKGFTLIELLVVVAIIGILAAVGTVAYSGYTSSAKKNAAKSNQSTVIKYISAELQKCNLDEAGVMKNSSNVNQLTCADRTTADAVATAVKNALNEFKNPYGEVVSGDNKVAIFVGATPTCGQATVGRTFVTNTSSQWSASTCFTTASADITTNTGLIE